MEGRTIYYVVADDDGSADDAIESQSFTFDGTSLEELSHRLEEVTGLTGIIICSRNPLNGKLYPLRLQLPPNNAAMHVVVVQESSKGEHLRFLFYVHIFLRKNMRILP